MMTNPAYKPALQVGHYITIWLFIGGLVMAGLSRGNDIENQQITTDTRQKEIIKQQAEIKADVKDARKEQAEIKGLLIQIKTKLEK